MKSDREALFWKCLLRGVEEKNKTKQNGRVHTASPRIGSSFVDKTT